MKKRLVIFLATAFLFQMMNAQNSAASANRNTALRCLRLAENCLIGGDWENAYSQAELGISYDDSISDLVYVKAASSINLGKTRSEALEIIRQAFKKDNWLGYSQNGARILYADLLCDTGDYESSLQLLDSDPFILSADAEFIRVKNLYRMGTKSSVSDARLKVNTARRIYPKDSRFPTLFFMFEYAFMSESERNGMHYEADETVNTIAAAYIAKLPDYTDLDNEVEILASFFAQGKEKDRLLKAIDSKNKRNHPLLAIAGLRNGMYSDQQAFNLFFDSVGDVISIEVLQDFTLSLTDPEVKLALAEKLTNYSASISVDTNLDLQNEMLIKYEDGRPSSIEYDNNMDGVMEITSTCDFGAPVYLLYPHQNTAVTYAAYPEVSKVEFQNDGRSFIFLHNDYKHEPLEFVADSVFTFVGIDFYIPRVISEAYVPVAQEIVDLASAVELPNSEYSNGKVVYSSEKGKLYFANFYENDRRYAYSDFSAGLPFERFVDTDGDGVFETREEYASIPQDKLSAYDLTFQAAEVERIFGKEAFSSNIYLKKIQIDRNANTFYEYSEEYYEYGGKMSSWDYDDDGTVDYLYIKSPWQEGNPLEECYVFNSKNYPSVTINFIDGIPVKLALSSSEEIIYAGKSKNFYWVAEKGSDELEDQAVKLAEKGLEQGMIKILESDDVRFSIINVSGTIFARILPATYISENDTENEED